MIKSREISRKYLAFSNLARSSSRLGHGPLKAGARVRVPYALLKGGTLETIQQGDEGASGLKR